MAYHVSVKNVSFIWISRRLLVQGCW